jgi:hypothetical protein
MAFDSTILNNNNSRAQAEDQQTKLRFDASTSTCQCFTSCMKAYLAFLITMSIPDFYAALMMKDSVFGKRAPLTINDSHPTPTPGIKAAMSTWKELRSIDGILLALVVATVRRRLHSMNPSQGTRCYLIQVICPSQRGLFILHFIFDDTGRDGNDLFHHPDHLLFWLSKGLCTINRANTN